MAFDKQELAWAAGFFDGEGCVYLSYNKANSGVPRLSVTQLRQEPLERFNRATGGLGSISGIKFSVTGFEKVQAIIVMLWPWLSEPKREQYIAKRPLMTAPTRRRVTACSNGHFFALVGKSKFGQCRECRRQAQRRYRARR